MPIPPEPILRAIARWVDLLPDAGEQRARSLLRTSAQYRDLTPTQYESALDWLKSVDLAPGRLNSPHARTVVFEHLVMEAGWFVDADLFVREPADLPLDAGLAAQALDLTLVEATQAIRNRWGKVDTARREEVGAEGERLLLELLRASLVPQARVEHVSVISDGLGFDIAISGPGLECHLEVKSTTAERARSFYLSRNEYEVSRFDPHWVLVLVGLTQDLVLRQVDTVDVLWLQKAAPADVSASARWESARFEVPPTARRSGIESLADLLAVAGPLGRFAGP